MLLKTAVAVTLCLLVLAAVWAWNVHFSPVAKARRTEAMAATARMRDAVLSREMLRAVSTDGISHKAFAMDWQVSSGQLATLVSFDDGTTSIYFSSGGGVIGAGELPTVRPVAERFRAAFSGLESHFHPIDKWPPPEPGSYVFYYLDRDATRASPHFPESEIRSDKHALHLLVAEAHNLITALRTAKSVPEDGK